MYVRYYIKKENKHSERMFFANKRYAQYVSWNLDDITNTADHMIKKR